MELCTVSQPVQYMGVNGQHIPSSINISPENPQEELGVPSQGTLDEAMVGCVVSDSASMVTLKPVVICLEGLIGAGKSTALQLAKAPLVLMTHKADDIAELTLFLALGIIAGAALVPRLIPLDQIYRTYFPAFS